MKNLFAREISKHEMDLSPSRYSIVSETLGEDEKIIARDLTAQQALDLLRQLEANENG